MRSKIKAVFWDMDGTLFNTFPGVEKAVREVFDIKGMEQLPSETIEKFIGPPIQLSFRDICGLPENEAVETADLFRKIYREKGYVEECIPYDGLKETLIRLKCQGFYLGVCTLKKQDMAERIVKRFGMEELFHTVIGTDAKDSIKKEDTVRLSCEELGIGTEESVLVGDTVFDPMGAEKAGSLFIGVTYGFGFKTDEDVDQFENIGTAVRPEDVYDIIDKYNSHE